MNINQTNRKEDARKERVLLPTLKVLLEKRFPDAEIKFTDSKTEQLQGSDFLIKSYKLFNDNEFHTVDAKAATDYIVVDGKGDGLPTFAMELASMQNSKLREGWAINNEEFYKNTEYFCFQWIFTKENTNDLSIKNISRIDVKIIPKKKLIAFINNPYDFFPNMDKEGYIGNLERERIDGLYHWMENTYNKLEGKPDGNYICDKLNVELKKGRLFLSLMNRHEVGGKGPKIVYTSKKIKGESPLNLTIAKDPYLSKLSIFSEILK